MGRLAVGWLQVFQFFQYLIDSGGGLFCLGEYVNGSAFGLLSETYPVRDVVRFIFGLRFLVGTRAEAL